MKQTLFLLFSFAFLQVSAQENKVETAPKLQFSLYDGAAVAGYADGGGFLNFTGPNVSWANGKSKLLLGMLPSLRFKEDNKEPKNAFVTPTLGAGITYCYKHFALQLPAYYNAKTSTADGKWKLGIGIGYRLKS